MTDKWRSWLPWVVIVCGLLAYANSFSGPFIFDDMDSIVDNPSIRRLWPLTDALVVPSATGQGGRPVVNLSYALNYALQGLQVRGYHAVNVAIHLLAGLVLLGIVRRTVERQNSGSEAAWVAVAVAVLWVLHPLQTETVDYISKRTEGLMGLFLLLTLYAAIRSFDAAHPARWECAAIAACALGMGCKEVMVAAPLLVLLYDYVFVTGSPGQSLRQRPRLYAGLAGTWLLLAALLASTSLHVKIGSQLDSSTPWEYVKMQCTILVHYLRLAFWPQPLVIDYDDWPSVASVWRIIPQGALILGLLALSAWGTYRRRWWGFLGAWFFLILAPTSSFLPLVTEVAAERRMYLPLVAVLVPVVVGLGRLRKWVVPAIALGFGLLTWQRNTDYRTAESIWRDAIAKRPGNARAHFSLGCALFQAGQTQQAIEQYEEAIRINPRDAFAHNNLGSALSQVGQTQAAIGHIEQALRIRPNFAEAHYNLGRALAQTGQTQAAMQQYQEALRISPDLAEVHNNMGILLAQQGQTQAAIQQYQEALRISPDLVEVHNNLGILLAQSGQTQAAIQQYEEVLQISPGLAEVHNSLGILLAQSGRIRESIGHFEQATRIRPDYAEAQNNLANTLAQVGRTSEAISHFEQALRVRPDLAEVHNSLGILLAQAGRTSEAISHFEQALRIRPDFAEAHFNFGNVLLQAGQPQAARGHYEQALRISPDYAEARAALEKAR